MKKSYAFSNQKYKTRKEEKRMKRNEKHETVAVVRERERERAII